MKKLITSKLTTSTLGNHYAVGAFIIAVCKFIRLATDNQYMAFPLIQTTQMHMYFMSHRNQSVVDAVTQCSNNIITDYHSH